MHQIRRWKDWLGSGVSLCVFIIMVFLSIYTIGDQNILGFTPKSSVCYKSVIGNNFECSSLLHFSTCRIMHRYWGVHKDLPQKYIRFFDSHAVQNKDTVFPKASFISDL